MSRGDERVVAGVAHGCSGAPVVAVRYRHGLAGQAARAVHLVALPVRVGAGAVSTLCGALLVANRIETVELGEGMPCTMCMLYRTRTRPSQQAPAAEDRPLLSLGSTTTALLIPLGLADRVRAILAARSCEVPILIHPDAPEHRVFLAGEPHEVPLPWPQSVQVVGGTLPLPPAVTPRGPVRWHNAPDRHEPDTSREIDVFGAVQTLLRDARQQRA